MFRPDLETRLHNIFNIRIYVRSCHACAHIQHNYYSIIIESTGTGGRMQRAWPRELILNIWRISLFSVFHCFPSRLYTSGL